MCVALRRPSFHQDINAVVMVVFFPLLARARPRALFLLFWPEEEVQVYVFQDHDDDDGGGEEILGKVCVRERVTNRPHQSTKGGIGGWNNIKGHFEIRTLVGERR